MASKILFVVEGKKTEKTVLINYFKDCLKFNDSEYEIYRYKTNIYKLYQKLEKFNADSFLSFLYSINKKIFPLNCSHPESAFSAVYLFFDLDPQDNLYNFETILKLSNYFDDETRNGKIYFSCPMVESIYDFSNLNQNTYNRKTYPINKLSKHYKHDSKANSMLRKVFGTNPSKIRKEFIYPVGILNMKKYAYLIGQNEDPSWRNPYSPLKIINAQKAFLDQGCVSIINCGVLLVCDYNPQFLLKLKDK